MATVTDWNDRGSTDQPWQDNYMYVVHQDDRLEVRVGYEPDGDLFRTFVQGVGYMHDGYYTRAQDAYDAAQAYAPHRLSSIWIWRLTEARDANPRPPRKHTRHHEQDGPGRRLAA